MPPDSFVYSLNYDNWSSGTSATTVNWNTTYTDQVHLLPGDYRYERRKDGHVRDAPKAPPTEVEMLRERVREVCDAAWA